MRSVPRDALAMAPGTGGRDAPASDVSGVGFRKELDVLALDPRARGSSGGLVWVPPQRRFYVARRPPTELFAVDLAGRPQPTLQLSGLADPGSWASWEGLAWIPPDAPAHGGTIAGLGTRTTDLLSHVFYVRLDGTVEAEIVPQPGTPLERYFCGIQYWPQRPGTLLLSDCGATGVWAMDMQTGALVGDATRPLLAVPEAGDVEGIVVRKNGQILLSGYESGRLYAFDRTLRRTPGQDRLFVVGLGVSAFHLGWNFDTGELLAITPAGRVFAVSPDLASARPLFDTSPNGEVDAPQGIAYLGGGQVAIANRVFPRGVDVADMARGHSLSRLLFFPPLYPAGRVFNVTGVGAYGPDAFVVRTVGDPNALHVVSRSGTPDAGLFPDGVLPDRLADLPLLTPAVGEEAQLVDTGADPRLFTGAEIYGLDGTLLHAVDAAALGIQEPPLRLGVWMSGNTFAAQDGRTSTVVVYTMH